MFRKFIASFATLGLSLLLGFVLAHAQNPTSKEAALGQQTFSACAGCHGLDGGGGEHAPNIATDPNVVSISDAALLKIVKNGIPSAGMPGFGKLFTEQQIEAVVHYLRALQGSRSRDKLPGSAAEGRELFFARAGCAECHMMSGKGGFLATDLSGYGKAHSPSAILDAIVYPNKNVDPRHSAVTVVTRTGKSYRGLVRNEDNFSVQMQTGDGVFHMFDKADLKRVDHQPETLMPANYGSRLSKSELDDLVSFLSQAESSNVAEEGEGEE